MKKKSIFTADVKKILKATIIAPAISIGACTILYVVWWIFSKLFYTIHTWMTAGVWPWFKEAWGYIIGIWLFIIITSIIYTVIIEKKNFKKQIIEEQEEQKEQKKEEIHNQIKNTLSDVVNNWDEYLSEQDGQTSN